MNWNIVSLALFDELEKIADAKKDPAHERVAEIGAPLLTGAGVGKTLSDLSWSKDFGASPRRKSLGALLGAAGGFAYLKSKQKKKARKRAQSKTKTSSLNFKGTATASFLSKPGKSISAQSPKIGRIGTLPK